MALTTRRPAPRFPYERWYGPRGAAHTSRLGGIRHSRGDEGGGVAVNPFTTPDAIYISRKPQDMRAQGFEFCFVPKGAIGTFPLVVFLSERTPR